MHFLATLAGQGLLTWEGGIRRQAARRRLASRCELRFASGQSLAVANPERSQILFDAAGRPRTLVAACSMGSPCERLDGDTANVLIPPGRKP